VHRDIKPQNILLEEETGRALVVDFGVARVLDEGLHARDGGAADTITGAGALVGTPRYMSPEQAAGVREVGPASDQYALGVALYEALTGAFPYDVTPGGSPLVAHATGTVVPVARRLPDAPAGLAATLERLLAKDPAHRFASTDDLLRALGEGDVTPTRVLAPPAPARRRRPRLLAAVALLAAVGLGAVPLLSRHEEGAGAVDPRRSLLVGFFENTSDDRSLDWLRVGGVELLGQSLARWQDLSVVDAQRLLDLVRRARLADTASLSQSDVIRLARLAGVWTAASGSVLRLGDETRITIRVYDVAGQKLLTTATATARTEEELAAAFDRLAAQIFDLAAVPATSLAAAEPPTRSLRAYRDYVAGIEYRSRWRLDSAFVAFRGAIAADSAFALAWYELSNLLLAKYGPPGAGEAVALADSALKYSAGRPEKERLLLDGYHRLLHSDFAGARERAAGLLQRDSMLVDAWLLLGGANSLDLTVQRDARGATRLPGSLATAFRAYERAIALDGSDHSLYPSVLGLLMGTVENEGALWVYHEPPAGDLSTWHRRTRRNDYRAALVGDSLLVMRADSFATRFRYEQLDSLRGLALRRAEQLVDQWVAVAPDEAPAWAQRAWVYAYQRRTIEALAAWDRATALRTHRDGRGRIGKLALMLELHEVPAAVGLADSLARRPGLVDSIAALEPQLAGMLGTALVAGGRVAAAAPLNRLGGEVRVQETNDPLLRRTYAFENGTTEFRRDAYAERLSRDDLLRHLATLDRQLRAVPDSEQPGLAARIFPTVAFAAAATGDTGVIRAWRARARDPREPKGADADDWLASAEVWASARAGDRAGAERRLAAARRMSDDAVAAFALGRAEELLGHDEAALRAYAKVDQARFARIVNVDYGAVLLPRSWLARAELHRARGEREQAIELYGRYLAAFDRPDAIFQPERLAAQRALAELTRADAGDRVGP